MPKIHFTDAAVKRLKLPAGKSQRDFFETIVPGRSLILTLNAGGRHAWSVLFYVSGRPKRRKLGYYGHSDGTFADLTVREARQAAVDFDVQTYLAQGKTGSFKQVAERWLERHVHGRLRTEHEIRRQLQKYVMPAWADRPFAEIRRVDVNQLLDHVEDEHGARQADCVLTTVRSLMVWQQSRDEAYTSPIVKGMKRDKRLPEQRSRDRILSDDEIRGLWQALDEVNPITGVAKIDQTFAGIIKLCLLTGQRREKVVSMKWADVKDGVWTIPSEEREKGNAGVLVLPAMALEIINQRPIINDSPFVFAVSRSRKRKWPRFSAWSQHKRELNKVLPIPHWVLHDLRRTARSLLARIKVPKDIGEKLLGHKEGGVLAIYDRHNYADELADAAAQLAGELERILKAGAGAEDQRAA